MDPVNRWNCQQLLEHPYMDANRDALDAASTRPKRNKNPSRTSTHVSETVRCHRYGRMCATFLWFYVLEETAVHCVAFFFIFLTQVCMCIPYFSGQMFMKLAAFGLIFFLVISLLKIQKMLDFSICFINMCPEP